jgi:hypothetical protein
MAEIQEVIHTGMQSLSSVEWKTSAKGELSYTVKVYNEDAEAAYDKSFFLMEKAELLMRAKKSVGS